MRRLRKHPSQNKRRNPLMPKRPKTMPTLPSRRLKQLKMLLLKRPLRIPRVIFRVLRKSDESILFGGLKRLF